MAIEELSAVLKVPVQTIHDWHARRVPYGPPAIKVGKYLRWKSEVVSARIDDQEPGR